MTKSTLPASASAQPRSAREARADMVASYRQGVAPAEQDEGDQPRSAREARADMIAGYRQRPAASGASGAPRPAAEFRQDAPTPPSSSDARAAMISGMGSATPNRRADGITNSGPHASLPPGFATPIPAPVIRTPEQVLDFWGRMRPNSEGRREAEGRTVGAMRRLLMRRRRLEFPDLPVMLDGKRVPGIVLDAAFTFLRLAFSGAGKAGLGPEFDPLDFLLDQIPRAEAAIKRSGSISSDWPANPWQWRENVKADRLADEELLGFDTRTLSAPLVLTSRREPMVSEAFPEELRSEAAARLASAS